MTYTGQHDYSRGMTLAMSEAGFIYTEDANAHSSRMSSIPTSLAAHIDSERAISEMTETSVEGCRVVFDVLFLPSQTKEQC